MKTPITFTCPAVGCNQSFMDEAERMIVRRLCILDGVAFDVRILPEPKGSATSTHLAAPPVSTHLGGMGEQTRGWVAAAMMWLAPGRAKPSEQRRPEMWCAPRKVRVPSDAVPLLLSDLRAFHIRTLPGMLASQGIGPHLVGELRERLCAHFTLLGRLLRNAAHTDAAARQPNGRATSRSPVAMLNYGGEWAGASYVRLIETVLRSCHVPVARVVLLHYNMGAILPSELQRKHPAIREYAESHWGPLLRWFEQHRANISPATSPPPTLRQAFWNRYVESTLHQVSAEPATKRHVEAYGVCNHSSRALHARLETSLQRQPADAFALLGGRAGTATWRGLIMLELTRRGLMTPGVGRWSAGRFNFCADEKSSRQAASELQPSERNGTVVREFCKQLPKVLDINPAQKSGQLEVGSPHEVWRGTRFGVTFETALETVSGIDTFVFITEKPLKPLFNLRPFVMLGSAGTLATLRALGFRTFAPTINEAYDNILDANERTRAVLDEVERLASFPASAWKPLLPVLVHNQRHLLCGGLHRELSKHALHAARLVVEISRSTQLDAPAPRHAAATHDGRALQPPYSHPGKSPPAIGEKRRQSSVPTRIQPRGEKEAGGGKMPAWSNATRAFSAWQASTPFLLDHLPPTKPSDTCALPLPAEAIAAAASAHQAFAAPCGAASIRVAVKEAGFFSTVHGALADIMGSATLGQHAVLDKLSVWQGKGCRHLSCYLSGLRKPCNASRVPTLEERRSLALAGRATSHSDGLSFERFARTAALMAQLLTPSALVARELRLAKDALNWDQLPRPLIGVHVRDGDSCNSRERAVTHRECRGLKAFSPRLRALAAQYKTRAIFLATDGQRVLNETARYPDFQWHVLAKRERFRTGAGAEAEPRLEARISHGTLDGSKLALESLVDMLLLAETDVLVGKFTSNLFRSAVELRAGRRRCVPPVVSLDAAWCFGPDHLAEGPTGPSGQVVRGAYAGDKFAC